MVALPRVEARHEGGDDDDDDCIRGPKLETSLP
jgi:hypothetical protein